LEKMFAVATAEPEAIVSGRLAMGGPTPTGPPHGPGDVDCRTITEEPIFQLLVGFSLLSQQRMD
jgi:hypothetical protein